MNSVNGTNKDLDMWQHYKIVIHPLNCHHWTYCHMNLQFMRRIPKFHSSLCCPFLAGAALLQDSPLALTESCALQVPTYRRKLRDPLNTSLFYTHPPVEGYKQAHIRVTRQTHPYQRRTDEICLEISLTIISFAKGKVIHQDKKVWNWSGDRLILTSHELMSI